VAKKKKPASPIDQVEVQNAELKVPAVVEEDVAVEPEGQIDPIDESSEFIEEQAVEAFAETVEEPKKAVVWPFILGGVVAATFGFAAARSNVVDDFLPPSWRLDAGEVALQGQISDAQLQIDTLNERLTSFSAELNDAPQTDANDIIDLSVKFDGLVARLDAIESRPVSMQSENVDFTQLREVAEKQQTEIDALLADARLVEQTSQEAASKTLARAAALRIVAAVESGAPFATALADLEATGASDIPEALKSAARDGVVTLAALQGEIPSAARAALAESLQDAEAGFSGFLKRQLGARSIAPREGDDADAVLSRIEGAVRQGRLMDALAEAETLPTEAKSAMSDWLEKTTTRVAVTTASEALIQFLAAN
jgi:hypothetical protein